MYKHTYQYNLQQICILKNTVPPALCFLILKNIILFFPGNKCSTTCSRYLNIEIFFNIYCLDYKYDRNVILYFPKKYNKEINKKSVGILNWEEKICQRKMI